MSESDIGQIAAQVKSVLPSIEMSMSYEPIRHSNWLEMRVVIPPFYVAIAAETLARDVNPLGAKIDDGIRYLQDEALAGLGLQARLDEVRAEAAAEIAATRAAVLAEVCEALEARRMRTSFAGDAAAWRRARELVERLAEGK